MTDDLETAGASKGKAGLVTVMIAGGLVIACVGVVAVATMNGGEDKTGKRAEPVTKQGQRPEALTPAKTDPVKTTGPVSGKDKDPWPECSLVRKWFEENLPDPKTLEIINWDSRVITEKPGPRTVHPAPAEGTATILVKIRTKNKFGALSAVLFAFYCKDGKCNGGPYQPRDAKMF